MGIMNAILLLKLDWMQWKKKEIIKGKKLLLKPFIQKAIQIEELINQNKKIGHLKWKKLKELCKKKDNKENEIFIIYKSNIKNINYTNI